MKVSSRWTQGLSPEDKKELEGRLLANKDLFEILYRILDERQQHIQRDRLNKKHYFLPAWSEYQAERNGEESNLSWVKSILPVGENND